MKAATLQPTDLLHPIVAALISVIVNYGGTFILVFQGAKAAGLSPEQTASWIWSVSVGVGLTGAWLSFRYREPIITAWSTPGAAFLIAVLPGTPYPGPKDARSLLWVADRPARPLDHVALASLCDVFIVRIFQVRGSRTPAGTVSMTSYFHAGAEELAAQGARPLLAKADTIRFGDQFHDQQAELWSDSGRLLATTTQVVWFRE